MKLTKIFFLTFFLTFSITAIGQEKTKYTIKTIVESRQITGYLIVSISKDKKIKTLRINSFKEIEFLKLRKKANAIISIKNIPKDKLSNDEYLKNGVLDNGF